MFDGGRLGVGEIGLVVRMKAGVCTDGEVRLSEGVELGTNHSCNRARGGLANPPGCCPTGLFGWVRPWLHQISISDAFFELAVTLSKVCIFGGLVCTSEMVREDLLGTPVSPFAWCSAVCRWLTAALGDCG